MGEQRTFGGQAKSDAIDPTRIFFIDVVCCNFITFVLGSNDDAYRKRRQVSVSELQERVDAIDWYHEFDFPNGVKARARGPDAEAHRKLWAFITEAIDKIDFTNKTVLEIGCWDGYWSFYAERRGAAHVLATDDQSQNWTGSRGLPLAKELLGSMIETNTDVSVYDLGKLNRTFDVILCLGVYYHLVDPFHAFAQIRHRCHEGSLVVFEGDVTTGMRPHTAQINLSDPSMPVFVPTLDCLVSLLKAAYFEPVSQLFFNPITPWTPKQRLKVYAEAITGKHGRLPHRMTRAVTICRPVELANVLHAYKPPFGLADYDPRFGETVAVGDAIR